MQNYLFDSHWFPLINKYILKVNCGDNSSVLEQEHLYTMKGAEGKRTRLIMLFWIGLYLLISFSIVLLFYEWLLIKNYSIIDIFSHVDLLVILLAIGSAFLVFLISALDYIKLLSTEVEFSKADLTVIRIRILGKNIRKYVWKDVKSMKRSLIDWRQFTVLFNDGGKLLLPHWPTQNIEKFLACLLQSKPNLAWTIEFYLRDIYASGDTAIF